MQDRAFSFNESIMRMHWDQPGTIDERFERFLAVHPELLEEFCAIALRLRRAGREHYSSDAIGHILRYERVIDGRDVDSVKINNNFIALLARRAMDNHPELSGFFETRARRGE